MCLVSDKQDQRNNIEKLVVSSTVELVSGMVKKWVLGLEVGSRNDTLVHRLVMQASMGSLVTQATACLQI